jgi:predicted nucleic acid-binding protein
MSAPVLADAGPLVAYLKERDDYHEWATDQFRQMREPLLTCEPVLAETLYLVRHIRHSVAKLFGMVERRALRIPFRLQDEAMAVAALMSRYENVPMALADACLVRMAEQHADATVFTLDSDFRVYRKNGRQVIPTLMPPDR